ncbi:hypothetical protein EJ08DRAFT_261922 [Tothia fuscella]|uniref:Transcription factor CBF/NF-Y/archaeal histone domain-containing protein n=1 Tax=Tothia fuscella TaxID=1048955 RepID=A0A9P4NRB2_9PEZI|nr:hypothetical protein EJ08DRAFT_261922 [Tothia fuscella]
MPYNNTPIAPPKEYSGTVSLPLARVKKIICADDEIQSCSNNAAFVITIATEMFVQHLVEKTHEIIKAEKRPRRNVQYADVANAIARLDHLEFLSDVVPRTTTYAKVQERQRRKAEADAAKAAAAQAESSQGEHQPQESAAHPGVAATNGHQTFSGPSSGHYGSRSREVNILDDTEPMEVDQQGNVYQQMPSTASMLEKARAASQRAESGPSPSSSAHPYQPPPHSNANAHGP